MSPHRLGGRRLVATLIASAALAIGAAGPAATAQDSSDSETSSSSAGGDTAVVTVNTKDDSNLFRFAFAIKRTMQDVVDSSNAAVAFASCEECQTVAVSFQVVLIMSDPDVVTSENLALALNYECSMCETLASAYQFVMTTGGQVRFTPEGNKALAELRQALLDLRRSDQSIEEIQTRLDELKIALAEVLATQLVLAGPPDDEVAATSPTSSMTPDVGPSSDPSVTLSPTPSPSASTTPSETPLPSESASETP